VSKTTFTTKLSAETSKFDLDLFVQYNRSLKSQIPLYRISCIHVFKPSRAIPADRIIELKYFIKNKLNLDLR